MINAKIIGGVVLVGTLVVSHHLAHTKSSSSPLFPLENTGSDAPIDYSLYGTFEGINTPTYRYTLMDSENAGRATGVGIFPNEKYLIRDPAYKTLAASGTLEGPLTDFSPEKDPLKAFYKWGSMKGAPSRGLRQFNVARSLELAGHSFQALKAYYSIVIHFPKEVSWQDGKPWYIGVSALDAVYRLVAANPEWKWEFKGGDIFVKNGFDRKGTNDLFYVNPGVWHRGTPAVASAAPMRRIVATRGGKAGQLVQWDNGHWQFMVDGQPFLIRGIGYSPSPVGKTPDWGDFKPHVDWMTADLNGNGRPDGPYDSFVDENNNNQQEANEKPVGDFALMKAMGVNTVRLYHHGPNKELLRELERDFGIRVLMGDFVGAYTLGSGATWEAGTDYTDPAQLENMRQSVREMVSEHKEERYVLLWVLGNENNYGVGNNAPKNLVAYYQFINSLAQMIRELDPSRPVALCNGDLENMDMIALHCPDVDVLAVNAYRGSHGMGESFWRHSARVWKKPVLISEFGCPAYDTLAPERALVHQANYLVENWNDIEAHMAGRRIGNSLGGVVFEWLDEWWKAGPDTMVSEHDTMPQSKGPFPDGSMYEEWLGIAGQGDGSMSPFLRQLRPAYVAFKNGPWKKDQRHAWKK